MNRRGQDDFQGSKVFLFVGVLDPVKCPIVIFLFVQDKLLGRGRGEKTMYNIRKPVLLFPLKPNI